jgi:DNA repair protein RecO (recombination protein O)
MKNLRTPGAATWDAYNADAVPTYHADAIVLRRLDYGEADRILTLLTREHGKLAAIARGARRGHGRRSSTTDLFARCHMMLARGRNLDIVTQVERLGDARQIAGDLRRTAYASLVAEVVDKVLEERHPAGEIFDLVSDTLERLNRPGRACRPDAAWFLMRILDALGYLPQLHECANCGRPLHEADAWFSPLLGGVLCPRCGSQPQAGSGVSVNGLKILRLMATGNSELYDRLRMSNEVLREVEDALTAQLEYHLDRELKSVPVIRALD